MATHQVIHAVEGTSCSVVVEELEDTKVIELKRGDTIVLNEGTKYVVRLRVIAVVTLGRRPACDIQIHCINLASGSTCVISRYPIDSLLIVKR